MSSAENSFLILLKCGYSEKEARKKSGYFRVVPASDDSFFDEDEDGEISSRYEEIRAGFDNGSATSRRGTWKRFVAMK